MNGADSSAVTKVFQAAADGDRQAAAELLPLLYEELRKLALSLLRKLPPGQTLQPTALVHEAYLRVAGTADPGWNGRKHFFAAAAQAMRNILVDQARRKKAAKRGGQGKRIALDESDLAIEEPSDEVLAVHEALELLEAENPRKGQIVNLHYFAGLTLKETAVVLGVHEGTVKREWRYTKRWLYQQLMNGRTSDER